MLHTRKININSTFKRCISTLSDNIGCYKGGINFGINICNSGELHVIERFGKYKKVINPGLYCAIPFVDKIAYIVETKELCLRIDPEEAITKDNAVVILGGNLYLQYIDAQKAAYGSKNPTYAALQLAQSVMRTQVGKLELDELFSNRKTINDEVVEHMKNNTKMWGSIIKGFEITSLSPKGEDVKEALDNQVIAERKKRKAILDAEAESEKTKIEADAYKYKQTVEADGDKYRILEIAEAEAESIRIISDSMGENSDKVLAAKISKEYIEAFGNVAKEGTSMIIPQDATNLSSILAVGNKAINSFTK